MIRIALLALIAAVVLIAPASAAYVSISAPQEVYVGDPLVVRGTSTIEGQPKPSLSPGFSTEIVLYYAQYAKREIDRKTIVVQEDGTFSATFETEGLEPGRYSIEIVDPTKTTFGGSSKTQQLVTLIDRSGIITIDSPLTQDFDGTLDIRGSIADLGDAGVQVRVEHDGFIVYGPTYLATDKNGAFSVEVPISAGGTYEVTFHDARGYIGSREFVVIGAAEPTPTGVVISATALASRSAPAYFEVETRSGTVTITTSSGLDWVVEYIDEKNVRHKVNEKGMLEPEKVEIATEGGTVYVKIYPLSYTDNATVQISAANARAVRVSQVAPALFGDAPPTPTQSTPLPPLLALLAVFVLVLARRG